MSLCIACGDNHHPLAHCLKPAKPPLALEDLAARLTPNPALSAAGTLAIILDGIDRLDEDRLARTLGYVSAREQGMDVAPLTDEEWSRVDPAIKQQLIYSAQALKIALREMTR